MAAGHAVDTDTASYGATAAGGLAEQAQNTANLMIGRLQTVIWQGRGGDAFLTACEKMKGDLQRINSALGWLANRLGNASVQYDNADVEGEQIVRTATASAGGIGSALRQAV
jgi:uncharacterized protein YukE